MGRYQKIIIKPFIKFPIQYIIIEGKIRTCGEHEDFAGNTFCPKCGKEIIIQKRPYRYMLWCEDLIGNENFYHYIEGDYMYFFSNIKDKTEVNTDEDVLTIISTELIDTMIVEFSEKHKEDIELLEAKLNCKLKVEFGFINHYR